jgi:hypothetical protein
LQYERQPIPREVFLQYRNENMKKNMLDAVREVFPKMAEEFDVTNINNF